MVNHQYHNRYFGLGFTLIELMIVVVIIGILAAIAYPNYMSYVKRTNRADVMAEMQQMASRIDANKITYKRYDKIPLSVIFTSPTTSNSVNYPSGDAAIYTITLSPVNGDKLGGSNWMITASPINTSRMKNDGDLKIVASGEKCWGKKCGMADEWRNE